MRKGSILEWNIYQGFQGGLFQIHANISVGAQIIPSLFKLMHAGFSAGGKAKVSFCRAGQ